MYEPVSGFKSEPESASPPEPFSASAPKSASADSLSPITTTSRISGSCVPFRASAAPTAGTILDTVKTSTKNAAKTRFKYLRFFKFHPSCQAQRRHIPGIRPLHHQPARCFSPPAKPSSHKPPASLLPLSHHRLGAKSQTNPLCPAA